MLEQITRDLGRGQALTSEKVREAVQALVSESVPLAVKADFLTALAQKGETTEEIAGFARELRAKAVPVPVDSETRQRAIIDVCGAGGDYLGTFNVSTTVALVVAAAGVPVAKHGNRAVTSKCGSADVVETLGIPINLSPEQAAQALREQHFAFLFAPQYHPAFKQIVPARRLCAERGQRTIFNFLGPLLNPASPSTQLTGMPQPQLCEPIACVLRQLGVSRGMVVSGAIASHALSPELAAKAAEGKQFYLDELSTMGENTVAEFYHERGFTVSVLPLDGFPIRPARLADLAGGDREANAEIIRRLLHGADRGPRRDGVLLNVAAALFVAGSVKNLLEGWDLGAEIIDSGKAAAKLDELRRG